MDFAFYFHSSRYRYDLHCLDQLHCLLYSVVGPICLSIAESRLARRYSKSINLNCKLWHLTKCYSQMGFRRRGKHHYLGLREAAILCWFRWATLKSEKFQLLPKYLPEDGNYYSFKVFVSRKVVNLDFSKLELDQASLMGQLTFINFKSRISVLTEKVQNFGEHRLLVDD